MASGAREVGKRQPLLSNPVKRALAAEILIAAGRILEGVGSSLSQQPEVEQADEREGSSNGL